MNAYGQILYSLTEFIKRKHIICLKPKSQGLEFSILTKWYFSIGALHWTFLIDLPYCFLYIFRKDGILIKQNQYKVPQ